MILVVFNETQKNQFARKTLLYAGFALEPVQLDATRWVLPRRVLVDWADQIPSAIKTQLQALPTVDLTHAEIKTLRADIYQAVKDRMAAAAAINATK